jgi:hypothetical protein
VTRQRTGFSADQAYVGALLGHYRYDAAIYLYFWGGRGKEKLWGADPSPLFNNQVELILQTLLLPNLASFLAIMK